MKKSRKHNQKKEKYKEIQARNLTIWFYHISPPILVTPQPWQSRLVFHQGFFTLTITIFKKMTTAGKRMSETTSNCLMDSESKRADHIGTWYIPRGVTVIWILRNIQYVVHFMLQKQFTLLQWSPPKCRINPRNQINYYIKSFGQNTRTYIFIKKK